MPGARSAAAGWGRFGLLAVLLLLLVIGHQVTLLPGNLLGRTLQNALHLPAFACLAFVLGRYFPRLGVGWGVLCCVGVGAGFELSQLLTSREASLLDLGHDLFGAAGGMLVARGGRLSALAALVIMLLVSAALPVRVWWSYLSRDRLFPVLLEPEASIGSALFSSNSPVRLLRDPSDAGDGARLGVCLADVTYPGFQLEEVVPDWSRFEALELALVVDPGEPVDLRVAIGRRGVPGTYAYVSRILPPGEQTWRIPLASLSGPAGSAEQLPVSHVIVYSAPAYAGRCLAFARIGLVRGTAPTAAPLGQDPA